MFGFSDTCWKPRAIFCALWNIASAPTRLLWVMTIKQIPWSVGKHCFQVRSDTATSTSRERPRFSDQRLLPLEFLQQRDISYNSKLSKCCHDFIWSGVCFGLFSRVSSCAKQDDGRRGFIWVRADPGKLYSFFKVFCCLTLRTTTNMSK